MAQKPANKRLGTHIEEERAAARDGERTPDTDWYDVIDDGERVEVKSTPKHVENPTESRKGRYQLVADNHERLVDAGGVYDFVLRDHDDRIIDVVTLTAEGVDKLLADNGRKWPDGSKLKILWTDIHDEGAL